MIPTWNRIQIPGLEGRVSTGHSTATDCFLLLSLGFTKLFNILGHQRRFQRLEKSDKFCPEALISASGSFTCRKSTTRDPRLYFPSEGSHTQDFYALKKIHRPRPGLNLGSRGEYDNHWTTGVDGDCFWLMHMVNMYLYLNMYPVSGSQINEYGYIEQN